MKIHQGKQEIHIELSEMHTDQRLTYWDAATKRYVPVEHTCLPTSHFLLGDDDRAQDLCMGTKRKYDWKLEAGMGVYGVNCDGDSEVEGDVFWTMPPKYELSY